MASGFSVFEPVGVPLRPVFRYKATEGRGGGERRSSCLREKRPAAFRDLCQIGYSGLFSPGIMEIKLIDRKESASYKGSIYELTLLWDRESIRKCFCSMPPFFAHIRKDGVNFAIIDCYSNDNGRFVVKKFMPSLLARPDWQVRFDRDINTIPFLELLAGLPI